MSARCAHVVRDRARRDAPCTTPARYIVSVPPVDGAGPSTATPVCRSHLATYVDVAVHRHLTARRRGDGTVVLVRPVP